MQGLGLHVYEMSSGKLAWFFPNEERFQGKLSYFDIFGMSRKRAILGFSAKNNVYWHFAIEMKAQYGAHPKICLIPHVVFSEDGQTPLEDKAKMHRLRRGFCKMWWNDRWRDMLLVYLNLLSGGELTIELPVSDDHFISLNARTLLLNSPVTLLTIDESEEIDIEVEDIEVEEVRNSEDII